MDFTVLEQSRDGYENILIVTDVFTKFVWAVPTRDQRAVTVARTLVKHIFLPFGCPLRLHSDWAKLRVECHHLAVRDVRDPQGTHYPLPSIR